MKCHLGKKRANNIQLLCTFEGFVYSSYARFRKKVRASIVFEQGAFSIL